MTFSIHAHTGLTDCIHIKVTKPVHWWYLVQDVKLENTCLCTVVDESGEYTGLISIYK